MVRLLKTFFAVIFLSVMFSCASMEAALAKLSAPYAVFETQIVERETLGVEFEFVNLSGKEIFAATFFVSLQKSGDDDWNDEEDEFAETVTALHLSSGESKTLFVPIDGFDLSEGIDDYYVQSLYAGKIVFEDGSEWDGHGSLAL